MLKSYLTIAFRNLLRNKVFSLVNIFGLGIGMAACFLIVQFIVFELSYDRFHHLHDRIFRVTNTRFNGPEPTGMATNNPGAGPALKAEFPEVVEYARAIHQSIFMGGATAWSHTDPAGNTKVFTEDLVYDVDPSFLTLFSFPFVSGNPQKALSDPGSVVISQTVSRKFFGSEDPLGKVLVLNGERALTITGVFEDVPENSHIKFNILVSFFLKNGWGDAWNHDWDWKWSEFDTYVLLDEHADTRRIESKFPGLLEKYLGAKMREIRYKEEIRLQPLTDIHLRSPKLVNERQVHGSQRTVDFLMIIAILILFIAWINYINLSTSKSMERAQEVGLRKVSGASRRQLVTQFLFESVMVNGIAMVLSVVLVVVALPYFNLLVGKNIYHSIQMNEWPFWLALISVFVLGSFLAGLYPAFLLSSFRIMPVLKGKFFGSKSGIVMRKALVGFQFVISVALIAGTIMVFKQVSFMRNQDLGYAKEQLLVVQAPQVKDSTMDERTMTFTTELLRNTAIQNVTESNEIPGRPLSQMNFLRKMDQNLEDNFLCNHLFVDRNFIDTYGMKLVAGRNFRPDEGLNWDTKINVVMLNEKAIKIMGYQSPEQAVNQRVYFGYGPRQEWVGEIIGVIGDFHQQSLKNDYDPVVFFSARESEFFGQYFTFKVIPSNTAGTISLIEQQYKRSFPGNEFVYFFMDDYFNRQYAADQQFGKVFGLFTGLAMLVTCLGLFGLSTFIIGQRSKEIAVRKVLGATLTSMIVLFSTDFVKLIVAANLMALPLIYWVVENWLNTFAFHVSIGWLMFVIPAVILLFISVATVSFQTTRTSGVNPAVTLKVE